MNEKLCIIGASGLIGSAVADVVKNRYCWVGTTYSKANPQMKGLDISDATAVANFFSIEKPTHVILSANLKGGLDFCQKHPEEARLFHLLGTQNVGRQCRILKSKFLYISTECVFDGKKEFYSEEDALNPLSIYGTYKAESEHWIQNNIENFCIVRTMWVFGWDPLTTTPNAIMQLLFNASKKNEVSVATFRWGNPTYVTELAQALAEIVLSDHTGIYHVAGSSYMNRYEWFLQAAHYLNIDPRYIVPQIDEKKEDSIRPHRVCLDTAKYRAHFKGKLHSIADSLEDLRANKENARSEGNTKW